MYKRGQIALFVVMAIIIVGGAFAIIYTKTDLFKKVEQVGPDIAPIQAFIENCIKETGQDALVFIGQRGGYYEPPASVKEGIAYFFYNNRSYLPSKTIIEQEISKYIKDKFAFCARNLTLFSDFTIEYKSNTPDVKTKIILDKVIIQVYYPIISKKADISYSLSKFEVEIPSRMYTVYNVTEEIIDENLRNPVAICWSCLTELGTENRLYIDFSSYDNETMIFTISDENITLKGLPYEFRFANKYG
jgi:hypothetical protein